MAGLTNGTAYFFELKAENDEDESTAADEVTATPADRPSKPRNLRVSPADGEVIVQWSAPARSGTAAIARYEYWLQTPPQDGDQWTAIPDSAPGGANHGRYGIGRDNGQFTAVYLRAVNADERAGEHARGSAVPFARAPSAPRNLEAVAMSGTDVMVAWDEPRARSGVTIVGYYLDGARVAAGSDGGARRWLGGSLHPPGTTGVTQGIGEDARWCFRMWTVFNADPGGGLGEVLGRQSEPGLGGGVRGHRGGAGRRVGSARALGLQRLRARGRSR